MIDQSGIDKPFVSGTTDFDGYFADPEQTFATNSYLYNWQSEYSFDLPLTGHVDFDLGATYNFYKMAVWNLSLSNVTVRVSDDTNSLDMGQVAGSFTLTNHQDFSISYPVDILDFGGSYQGRYVRLDIASTYLGSPGDGYAYAIIGEVVFSAVPVSAALPMLSIARVPGGDVEVTFAGALQTSTNIGGPFQDVPGNPQGVYVVSKDNLFPEQYFRAKGN